MFFLFQQYKFLNIYGLLKYLLLINVKANNESMLTIHIHIYNTQGSQDFLSSFPTNPVGLVTMILQHCHIKAKQKCTGDMVACLSLDVWVTQTRTHPLLYCNCYNNTYWINPLIPTSGSAPGVLFLYFG